MKKYRRANGALYLGAAASVLFSAVFAVVLQFFKGQVLDNALAANGSAALGRALLLLCFIVLELLFYYLYNRLAAAYTAASVRGLKRDIFESLICRGYVDYLQKPQGEYISIYTNQTEAIKIRKFELEPIFWEILFKIVLVSAGLFLLDWRVAFICLFLLSTPLYVPKLIEKRLQRAQGEYLRALERELARVNDWLSGFELIKNYGAERRILGLFDKLNHSSWGTLLQDKKLSALSQLISALISYLSYFIVLAFSAWLVLRGDFSAGDFFVAIGMIDQLSYPLISLAEIIRQLLAIGPVCREMEAFIAQGQADEEETAEPAPMKEELRFQNVSFSYGKERPILRELELRLKKGGRCLIQGPSGCGKTTAINLLLGYLRPETGEILMDGRALSGPREAYRLMTVLRQEPVLFNDSLRSNLSMYADIPEERLIEALESVGLSRLANSKALDAVISENGANLSGGEKKRVCLARALLRDQELLILDEPLANLDEDTAGKIEDLLLSVKNRTILLVSHQFSPSKRPAFSQVLELEKQ